MRALFFAVVVLLFALLGAQGSANARTIVRAHAIASVYTYDQERLEESRPTEAPGSPRQMPHDDTAVVDPADARGAEQRSGAAREPSKLEPSRRRPRFERRCDTAPSQAMLGFDVPPPR